jgi:DNA repair protein RecN (Recombination protein N)
MLVELAVRDLGVIDELSLVFGPGMTALTGETGAGKTLVVEAIELLCGGRADGSMVRAEADEAAVEARFVVDGEEVVVRRVVPRSGRSRAYVDGQLATVASLVERAEGLVDLHGQHSHQSLLAAAAQRGALDRFGDVASGELVDARRRVRAIDDQLAALGGDERVRARELDLLRFQLGEIEGAAPEPDEDERLRTDEENLADAVAHREAAAAAVASLADEDGALDAVGRAVANLRDRPPFVELLGRIESAAAELDEAVRELRDRGESIEEDPEQLERVVQRRQLLHDLMRKYGADLEEVLAYSAEARARLDELALHEERAAALEEERRQVEAEVTRLEQRVGLARRRAAPKLAAAVEAHLADLALPHARLAVEVGPDPGDDVAFLLAANPGSSAQPLAKVASGGELARVMLALRLVLTAGPPTLVFDEVDAGIGGATALTVGRALTSLGGDHQVLVVTHLPQVAAFADDQVAVTKSVDDGRTTTRAQALDADGRIVELSRMLSGTPESDAAHEHAEELLAAASAERSARTR